MMFLAYLTVLLPANCLSDLVDELSQLANNAYVVAKTQPKSELALVAAIRDSKKPSR